MNTDLLRRVVFLLYDSRSGSTLLAALLNQYAPICVSQESAFISRVIGFPLKIKTTMDLLLLLDHLWKEVQFQELGISRQRLEEELGKLSFPISKKEFIFTLLNTYFYQRDPQAEIWVVKHHPYEYIHALQSAIPGVRFIHLIRDGRAVYSSKKINRSLDGDAMEDNLLKAAIKWRTRTQISEKHPGIIFELRYEDFVRQPEANLGTILDFLEVPPADRVIIKTQADYYTGIGEKQKRLHANVGRRPDPAIADGWKNSLDAIDVYLYEKINGDRLLSLGYPLIESGKPHSLGFILKAASRRVVYTLQYVYLNVSRFVRRTFTRKHWIAKISKWLAPDSSNRIE